MFNSLIFSIDLTFVTKCLISILIGFILGIEREYRSKPAGVKTYAMICLGATFFTHISISMSSLADPSRVAAQIVSGLGFIGAGTIFQSKRFITGLTTASTLWVVGSLGTLVGLQMYFEALFGLIVIYLYMFLSRVIQNNIIRYDRFNLEITLDDKSSIEDVLNLIQKRKIRVLKQKWVEENSAVFLEVIYIYKKRSNQMFLSELNKLNSVKKLKV